MVPIRIRSPMTMVAVVDKEVVMVVLPKDRDASTLVNTLLSVAWTRLAVPAFVSVPDDMKTYSILDLVLFSKLYVGNTSLDGLEEM